MNLQGQVPIQIHQGQPVLLAGEPLKSAHGVMILVHGRGATASDILQLTQEFGQPGFAYLAPQAAMNTWYPNSFMTPIEKNEPWLSSALAVLTDLVDQIQKPVNGPAIHPEQIILLGFSQGACLALEFAARNARRYGGLIGLSGGLIGPEGTPREYSGSLEGTPVFLGCSDIDPHIPKERVQLTAQVLGQLGGEVTMRLYPGMGHTVNEAELKIVREIMQQVREKDDPSNSQDDG